MAWVFGLSMFLSAALLFAIQPMMGKVTLPKFGGGPAVWTTCMVFFQAALLAGYGYAHAAPRRLSPVAQRRLHIVLLFLPLLLVPLGWLIWPFAAAPLSLHESWAPPASTFPAPFVFLVLLAVIGLPFFVLSTTAPLLQKWFAATGRPGAQDPYFLYAASNLGSLIALLGYPFLAERYFSLTAQGWFWLAGYAVIAALVTTCMLLVPLSNIGRSGASPGEEAGPLSVPAAPGIPADTGDDAGGAAELVDDDGSQVPEAARLDVPSEAIRPAESGRPAAVPIPTPAKQEDPESRVSARQRFFWVARAFVPSSLMLGLTMHFTTDIAPIPLLWVLPLAIYLISFIIAFSRLPLVLFHFAMPAAVLLLAFKLVSNRLLFTMTSDASMEADFAMHLGVLFVICTSLHGAIAADRPATRHLTEFFLWIALGGVLGGSFNAWVAPLAFYGVAEYPLALVLAALVMPKLFREAPLEWRILADIPMLMIIGVMGALLVYRFTGKESAFSEWVEPRKAGLAASAAFYALLAVVPVLLARSERIRWGADWLMPLAIGMWALAMQAVADVQLARIALLTLAATLVLMAILDVWQRRWWHLAYLIWPAILAYRFYYVAVLYRDYYPYGIIAVIDEYAIPLALAATALDRPLRFGLSLGAIFMVGGLSYYIGTKDNLLHRERSFFGVCKVTKAEHELESVHKLVHGSTVHGMQANDPKLRGEATTYYHRFGPLGDIMRGLGDEPRRAAIGVIGLGTGTVATYGQPGQEVVYFEIDPAMVRIARDPRLFSFLADAEDRGVKVRIVLGDGRVQLAQEPDGLFGVIVIDAFSSDAIPAHLITREALQTYLKKLAPGGVLAFHISNRYLDLEPVLGNLASDAGLVAVRRNDANSFGLKFGSEWVAVARDAKDLDGFWRLNGLPTSWQLVPRFPDQRLWTDDYNNLLDVYNWRSEWKETFETFMKNVRLNLGMEQ